MPFILKKTETLTNKFNIMTPQEKEITYLPIKTTKDTFTIGACGKFREDKKHLTKTEAIYLYAELHKWIFAEEKTETENIYLNRLKEQYELFKTREINNQDTTVSYFQYKGMRLFCLDTQLVSFNDIEILEFEVNQSFS